MIFDQGFEITIPDRQDPSKLRTFFNFMHYSTQGPNVTTDCGRSLLGYGWVHDVAAEGAAPEDWQCYTAQKQGATSLRRHVAATHSPGPMLGVPRSPELLAAMPRAVRDTRPPAVKYAGLPASFDWSNVSNVDYIEPMRDQLT